MADTKEAEVKETEADKQTRLAREDLAANVKFGEDDETLEYDGKVFRLDDGEPRVASSDDEPESDEPQDVAAAFDSLYDAIERDKENSISKTLQLRSLATVKDAIGSLKDRES